jgi:tetratricopeptide (TPR) repeat protein
MAAERPQARNPLVVFNYPSMLEWRRSPAIDRLKWPFVEPTAHARVPEFAVHRRSMSNEPEDNKPKPNQRKQVPAALRERLQQSFNKGQLNIKQRNLDYATDMFAQCVEGDPGNLEYFKAFIDTLQKKYNNNKKGAGGLSGFKGMGARGSLSKGIKKEDWPLAVKGGIELLKMNPWDIPALTQFAVALGGLACYETQLFCLKLARDLKPGDLEINRACAKALEHVGQFDQAMACWEQVKKYNPNNDEAQSAIAALHANKIEAQGSTKEAAKAAKKGAESITREEELRAEYKENPAAVGCATELSELLAREERFAEAEEVLDTTLQATGGDVKVREQVEEMQIRAARHQVMIAEKRAQENPGEESKTLFERMRTSLNKIELEVYRARCERYPGNTNVKYEFAVRLKRFGKYNEAIKAFQEARGDAKRRATVGVELGECFRNIKQYKLAIKNYEDSFDGMTDRDGELRKKAHYLIAYVAMEKLDPPDLDKAEKHLNELAARDFGYKDVSERLDKIAKMRDKD